MDSVNNTLYIPLYGKSYVSEKNIIIQDKKAEEIWKIAGFPLKGKAKSKWLAYFLAMRAAVYDEWTRNKIANNPDAVVLHIGCGLDNRIERVAAKKANWYDIDFPEVIAERKKYYIESEFYHMLPADMREPEWKNHIAGSQDAIIILEGVSMYFTPEELVELLSSISEHFFSVRLLMDCYTKHGAKFSRYRNPINEVGVNVVYGYDRPQQLVNKTGFLFVKEHSLTPEKFIDELHGLDKMFFKHLYAGKMAASLYRMYEFEKEKRQC